MEFIDGINTPEFDFLGINLVFKLLFFVILVGYVFYAFLMLLRVRILGDTVATQYHKFAQTLASGTVCRTGSENQGCLSHQDPAVWRS